MLRIRTLFTLALSLLAVCLLAQSAAASVAYIDGNEVWVASDDGARKLRLSAGENDWREVAQSDQGYIVGTRRESGKISQLASFTVWDPSGKVVHFGSLSGAITGGLNSYPLSLDITPTGGNLVYGFFATNFDFSSAGKGTYLKVTADASTAVPLALQGAMYPTLVGTRILATNGSDQILLQDPSSIGSSTFVPWQTITVSGELANHTLRRVDASATGTIFSGEFQNETNNLAEVDKVVMWKFGSLGTDSYIDDCLLPNQGPVHNVSISQDAIKMTWADARGVLIAPTPNLRTGGPSSCDMPAPAVLSATGTYPSYGPFVVPASAGTGGGGGGPTVSVGSKIKLATAIKSGFKISVTSAVAGKAKATLSVKPSTVGKKGKKAIEIAKGSANLAAGAKKRIKLKFTKKGKSFKKKLKGKKATLTVTVGGAKTTKTIKFK